MKTLTKRMLSEKHRRPVSADGYVLKKGSTVFLIHTVTSGREWFVTDEKKIAKTNRRGMVAFENPPVLWHWCLPAKDQVGDHRIYAGLTTALEEVDKRNAVGKRRENLKS